MEQNSRASLPWNSRTRALAVGSWAMAFAAAFGWLRPTWLMLSGLNYRYFFPVPEAFRAHFTDTLLLWAFLAVFAFLLRAGERSLHPLLFHPAVWLRFILILPAVWSVVTGIAPGLEERLDLTACGGVAAGIALAMFLWRKSNAVRAVAEWTMMAITVPAGFHAYIHSVPGGNNPDRQEVIGHSIRIVRRQFSDPDAAPKPNGRKVVWLIFDELDESLLFERQRYLEFPNFDALEKRSLHGTSMAPAHYRTAAAIPAMLKGKPMRIADIAGDWGKTSNLFRDLRDRHVSTSVVGWYHPYCEVLGSLASSCVSVQEVSPATANYLEMADRSIRLPFDFLQNFGNFPLQSALGHWLRAGAPASSWNAGEEKHRRDFVLVEDAVKAALDQDFVMLHVPVPHLPGIMSAPEAPRPDYFDNLKAADLFLGKVLELLAEKGISDRTTIVVSSDHHYRYELWAAQSSRRVAEACRYKEDPRIPLLVAFPKSREALRYTAPLSAFVMRPLLDRVVSGQLNNVNDTADWFRTQPASAPLSVPRN